MIDNNSVIILGESIIDPSAQICSGVIIGKPYRKFLDGTQEEIDRTIIDKNTYVGYYSVIGTGSRISTNVIIDDHCIIESRVIVGQKSLITYRSQLCNDVIIGEECIVGGFIGERTQVGSGCRIFGSIVHLHHNPLLGWDDDDATEGSSIIKDRAFIGFGAKVVGNVTIGCRAYICAGAIVTMDVPEAHIASGTNQIVHFSEWKGELKDSPFFINNGG
ncbi:MAG: hypothetical protein ABIJ30_01220 [bacterium]|nr:hypothetical protein [Patescibacteria group bacterium]